MEEKPIRDERIVEAIEACRPASGDVSDPALASLAEVLAADAELRSLYQRCQQLDAHMVEAFHDVPVPEGVAARVLAGLAAVEEPAAATGGSEPVDAGQEPAAVAATPQASSRRVSRRRWVAMAAVAAGIALSTVIGLTQFRSAEPLSSEQVLSQAIDFFSREPELPGTLLSPENEPEAYPFSRDVYRFARTRFRPVERFLGGEAMAYDLTSRLGTAATLYVVRPSGVDLAGIPSSPPPSGGALRTLGCASAAWHSDGLLYVLVVSSDSRRVYDSFLPPPGPVT